jgi:MFS family permease
MLDHVGGSAGVHEGKGRSKLRVAQVGVTAAFIAHAMLFASWTAHIPHIKTELGLSDATLGTALLGAPLGSVTSILISRPLLPRVGSHHMARITVIGYALAGVAVGQASTTVWLFATLSVWGFFQGGLDIAMNTQGVTVEKAMGTPIMARLHGMWSVGGFVGALIGSGAVSVGLELSTQLVVLGAIALVVVEVLTGGLIPDRQPVAAITTDTKLARPHTKITMSVTVLGAVAFASMLCEGASADWSANYLSANLGAPAGIAGLGYAAYTLIMVMIRLSGSLLQARVPVRVLLPILALVPAMGMSAALLVSSPIVGILGFTSLGIGLALVVPNAFSAASAAADGAGNAGSAIATVAAMGWIGYVSGPPLIGHLAELVGLRGALAVLPVLALSIATAIRFSSAFVVNLSPATSQ